MAEKPEDQVTMDEKIAKGKELFGRGARNYYVKCYVDAADDLSEASKLYGEAYGIDGDELGEVYLLYAKALIALGQDENKLIEVPEGDEEEDEPAEEDDGDAEGTEKGEPSSEEKTNGHSDEQKENEPEAGPSSSAANANENESSNDADEGGEEENEDDSGNLEIAWEVLQNAALIFQRQEDKGLKNLLEVYNEMAGISIENGNFTLALDDFSRALNTFDCLDDAEKNFRIAAEIHYKIGLCQSMGKAYDEAVKAFQKAHDFLTDVIEKEKAKAEQSDDVLENIKDMQETQQEIMNKITEIGEVKADEIEQVKRELTKLYGMNGNDPGAGCSSSSSSSAAAASTTNNSIKSPEAAKPKPTDISHLVKRKKPDSDAVENSPAKKKIVETSPGESKAVAVSVTDKKQEVSEKIAEETASVQVAVDN